MNVIGAPLLLAVICLFPLFPAWLWFRHKNYGTLRFLLPAAAGVISAPAAGLVQNFLPLQLPGQNEFGNLLFGVFVRVSLTEELVRLFVLFLLFTYIPFTRIVIRGRDAQNPGKNSLFFGSPGGLAAGLGFAAGESIFYSISDPGIAVLRIFSAVPLHAACGIRMGNALGQFRQQPAAALILVISAILIHAIYDLSIQNPVIPGFLPVVIAFAALVSSLINLYYSSTGLSEKKKQP